jgi:DNA processing protein
MNRRTLAWLILNQLPGAGAVTLRRLASRFGSPEQALAASAEELVVIGGLSIAQAQGLRNLASHPTRTEHLAARLEQAGVSFLTLDDPNYPANLGNWRDAPPLLYLRGTVTPSDDVAVAIIGTRTPCSAGGERAHDIAEALAERGVTVVSGLALGIDAAAHRGALGARCEPVTSRGGDRPASVAGGRTIAVIGSGIDRITPQRHRALGEEIIRSGAVIAEVPPGTQASRETLLARNRIQAGLAKAVIVVQCRSRGGSFTTVRRALTAGRPVFAVRSDEPDFAAGAERLAEIGARMTTADEAVELAVDVASRPLPRMAQREIPGANGA